MKPDDEQPRPEDVVEESAYFIRQGPDVQGPFPAERLRAWARQKKLQPEMEVSPDGTRWTPAREIPDLFTRRSPRRRVRTRGWTFLHTMKTYTPKTHATTALIVLNTLIFIAIVIVTGVFQPSAGAFHRWGANYGPSTTQGEWWRLFTCTFLHADFLHLALNMIILFYIGRLMERLLGRGGFLVLYVFAGLTGSLGSLIGNEDRVSVGASGSIFGLFGGILGFLSRRDRDPIARGILAPAGRTAAIYMLIELGLGWRNEGVDYAAHVGGFVGGFAMGCVLAHPLTEKGVAGRRRRWILAAALGLVLVAGGGALMDGIDEVHGPFSQHQLTERWLHNMHDWVFRYEEGRPEAENLVGIYAALAGESHLQTLKTFGGGQFSDFKRALADLAVDKLEPIGSEMNRLMEDPAELDRLLVDGAARARAIAEPVYRQVRNIVGFIHEAG